MQPQSPIEWELGLGLRLAQITKTITQRTNSKLLDLDLIEISQLYRIFSKDFMREICYHDMKLLTILVTGRYIKLVEVHPLLAEPEDVHGVPHELVVVFLQ